MTKISKNLSCDDSSSSSLDDDNATTTTLDLSYSDHMNTNNDSSNDDDRDTLKILRKRHPFKDHSMNNTTVNTTRGIHKEQQKNLNTIHTNKSNSTSSSPFLLFICASGICICYLYFGIVQEKLFSKSNTNQNSEIKKVGNTTTFMLLLSCITNVIVSVGWIWTEQRFQHVLIQNRNVNVDEGKKTREKKLSLDHKTFFQCKVNFYKRFHLFM